MTIRDKATLKAIFGPTEVPNAEDYSDLIDSLGSSSSLENPLLEAGDLLYLHNDFVEKVSSNKTELEVELVAFGEGSDFPTTNPGEFIIQDMEVQAIDIVQTAQATITFSGSLRVQADRCASTYNIRIRRDDLNGEVIGYFGLGGLYYYGPIGGPGGTYDLSGSCVDLHPTTGKYVATLIPEATLKTGGWYNRAYSTFRSLKVEYKTFATLQPARLPIGPVGYVLKVDSNHLPTWMIETAGGGSQGPKGDKGETGDQGPIGPVGLPGDKGETGDQGPIGPIGLTGPSGPKGDTGDQGIQGVIGLTGPKGDKGDQGIQGPTGLKGDTGDQGVQGPIGPIGLPGVKGDTGDQGIQGIQGVQGIKGDTGSQGPKGDQGIQGLIGLTGPKGDTGDQGIQGVIGLTGPKGNTGDQGIQGPIGLTGSKGDTGDQGIQGPIGPIGLTGSKGDIGLTGPAGPNTITIATTTNLTGFLKGNGSNIGVAKVALGDMADMPSPFVLGRVSPNMGSPELLTDIQIRTMINVANGANNYVHPNHSGDVTSIGDGLQTIGQGKVLTAMIHDGAVTLAKMADMATASVIYRKSAGTGAPEVQSLATLKTDLGLIGTNTGDVNVTLSGDVIASSLGGYVATISDRAVSFKKMADLAANSLIGNNTGSPATPLALTVAQVRVFIGAGSGNGLDADTVDGQHASAFSAAAHNHDAVYLKLAGGTLTGKLTITPVSGDGLIVNGNVGIGTLNPNSTLHVHGGALRISNSTTGLTTNLYIGYDGGTPSMAVISNQYNGDMIFGTNNLERVRITADGVVNMRTGIFDTLIDHLVFSRDGNEPHKIQARHYVNPGWPNNDGLYNKLNFQISNGTIGVDVLTLAAVGWVGIGTPSTMTPIANHALTVMSGQSHLSVIALYAKTTYGNAQTRNWALAANLVQYGDFAILQSITKDGDPLAGAGRIYIGPNGNVGIGVGTSVPTSKFQVYGLPEYASTAAAIAAGLTSGAFYKLGGGDTTVHVIL